MAEQACSNCKEQTYMTINPYLLPIGSVEGVAIVHQRTNPLKEFVRTVAQEQNQDWRIL